MSLELWLGIGFGLLTAALSNASFLMKHRGAVEAPAVTIRRPLRSFVALFRSRWWAIGFAVAVSAWVVHVAALALAPLSIVQAVIAGGFVLLAVFAERWFGFELARRQWFGVGLVAAGLALLGATADIDHEEGFFSVVGMVVFQAALLGIAVAIVVGSHARSALVERRARAEGRARPPGRRSAALSGLGSTRVVKLARTVVRDGVLLGVAAGLLYGASNIAIKKLTGDLGDGITFLLSPWTLTAVLAAVGAFYASARSLQIGEAMSVITATTAAANLSAIAAGILVFGDPIGDDPVTIVARGAAFALVIAGAVVMPAPVRAVRPDPGPEPEPPREGRRAAGAAPRREPRPSS